MSDTIWKKASTCINRWERRGYKDQVNTFKAVMQEILTLQERVKTERLGLEECWGLVKSANLEKNDLKNEIQDLKRMLGDLLAVIHKDDGHHTEKVGLQQSVESAVEEWADMTSRMYRLEEKLEGAESSLYTARHRDTDMSQQIAELERQLRHVEEDRNFTAMLLREAEANNRGRDYL